MPFPRDRESVKKASAFTFCLEKLNICLLCIHKKYVRIHFFDNQITKKTMDLKKKFSCSDQFVHPLYIGKSRSCTFKSSTDSVTFTKDVESVGNSPNS